MSQYTTTWDEIQDYTFDPWQKERHARIMEHLEYIGEVDLIDSDYDFDLIRVWVKKDTGRILYADDSGCSCPLPFGNTRVRDLLDIPYDLDHVFFEPDGYLPRGRRPLALLRKDLRSVVDRARDYVQQNLEEGRL